MFVSFKENIETLYFAPLNMNYFTKLLSLIFNTYYQFIQVDILLLIH